MLYLMLIRKTAGYIMRDMYIAITVAVVVVTVQINILIIVIMVALCNRADHYIFILFLLLFLFPRLISAVRDWMSAILPHMVWPQCEFRM